MDSHIACLTDLCRICGGRFSRDNRRYTCLDYRDRILKYYKTDVQDDNAQLHPPNFYFPCYMALFNCERSQGTLTTIPVLKVWVPHSDNCSTCSSCKQQRKGGRPSKKIKKRTVATGQCYPELKISLREYKKLPQRPTVLKHQTFSPTNTVHSTCTSLNNKPLSMWCM